MWQPAQERSRPIRERMKRLPTWTVSGNAASGQSSSRTKKFPTSLVQAFCDAPFESNTVTNTPCTPAIAESFAAC